MFANRDPAHVTIFPTYPDTARFSYNARGERITAIESALSVIDSTLAFQEERKTFLKNNCLSTRVTVVSPPSWQVSKDSGALLLPLSKSHERQLLEQAWRRTTPLTESRNPDYVQYTAVKMLCRCFKVDVSSVLFEMLESNLSEVHRDGTVVYPARQFAYWKLQELGHDVEEPEYFRPDLQQRGELVDTLEEALRPPFRP